MGVREFGWGRERGAVEVQWKEQTGKGYGRRGLFGEGLLVLSFSGRVCWA